MSRRTHILDGDTTGGGHRAGTGRPGKTEFPSAWSDDKIIEAIECVADDPVSARTVKPNGRTVFEGRYDGQDIRVVVEADDASIVTGFPINVAPNP